MKIDYKKLSLFLLILLMIVLVALNRESLSRENLDALLTSLGLWAPLVYIAIYSIALLVFFPATILTVLSGFVFGLTWGTVYTVIGCTIGSTLAFLIGRYLAKDWVETNSDGMLGKIKAKVDEQGWRFVAFARLLPIFPFTILNFVFGLTKISAITYAITSFIFMIPLIFTYVYIGHIGQGLFFE